MTCIFGTFTSLAKSDKWLYEILLARLLHAYWCDSRQDLLILIYSDVELKSSILFTVERNWIHSTMQFGPTVRMQQGIHSIYRNLLTVSFFLMPILTVAFECLTATTHRFSFNDFYTISTWISSYFFLLAR